MSQPNNKSSLFKSFTTLFSGLLMLQIINFLYSLLLPKYFTPNSFAEFGIFTSIVFIFIEIINAKFDIALMLGKDEINTKNILDTSFTVAVIASLLLLLIELPFYFVLPKIYFLLPFTIFLYGVHQPILVYLNKQEYYKSINIFRIIQVLITCIITLSLGMAKINHALVIGFCSGIIVSTLFVLKFIRPNFSWQKTKEIWKQFDQFPKYGTWSALFNNFSRNSVPLILSAFFTQQFVGYYSYTVRLLNAPTGMFSSALGQVYFKKASILDDFALKSITQKIIKNTFLISIIPTLFILFFGKELFQFLFNDAWIESGKIAQYLILWYFMGVIVSPISTILDLKNKLKFEFQFNFILLIGRISALCIGGLLHNFYVAILLYSIIGVMMNIYLLYYIDKNILPTTKQ